jgi:cyclic-di-AMP phosphodiesterase PgpH
MRLLERLGFARKPQRRRPGSFELQRRPKTGRSLTREEVIARVVIFSALVVLTMLMFPQAESYEIGSRVREGDIWQRDEVIAPFSFAVFKSEEQLQAERDSVRYEEPPVFARVPEAQQRTRARLDSLELRIERVLDAYVDWQENLARDNLQGAQADSARLRLVRRFLRARLLADALGGTPDVVRGAHGDGNPGAANRHRPSAPRRATGEVAEVSNQILPLGVLDVPRDSVLTPQIAVVDLPRPHRRGAAAKQRVRLERRGQSRAGAVEHAVCRGRGHRADRHDPLRAGAPALARISARRRRRALGRARARISRNVGLVQEGEAIVRRGDYVTEEIQRRLESLARVRAEQQGGIGPWRFFLGSSSCRWAGSSCSSCTCSCCAARSTTRPGTSSSSRSCSR